MPGDRRAVVRNEFAAIEVVVVETGRGDRLLLCDLTSGEQRFIDPLVLQALVVMPDDAWERLAHPRLVAPRPS